MSIYLHLAEGFEEIEAITILDVLRRAGLAVESVSVTGKKRVCGAHGIAVEADMLYEDVNYENCEMIVLPGGMPGTANLAAHEGLCKHICCFAEAGKKLAAICAAPMVFSGLGILEGKKATIYPGMEEKLTAGGAEPTGQRVIVDGNFVMGKAPGTAMDFALTLVEILSGPLATEQLRTDMVYGQ